MPESAGGTCMDSLCWDDTNKPQLVIELPNGDVWVGSADVPGGRRFRCHLGHVVEVFENGRLRRVGPGLRPERPWLRVQGPLEALIELALQAGDRDCESSAPSREPVDAVPARANGASHGLLGRLAALWHRNGADGQRSEVAAAAAPGSTGSAWRDTMPWTHLR